MIKKLAFITTSEVRVLSFPDFIALQDDLIAVSESGQICRLSLISYSTGAHLRYVGVGKLTVGLRGLCVLRGGNSVAVVDRVGTLHVFSTAPGGACLATHSIVDSCPNPVGITEAARRGEVIVTSFEERGAIVRYSADGTLVGRHQSGAGGDGLCQPVALATVAATSPGPLSGCLVVLTRETGSASRVHVFSDV